MKPFTLFSSVTLLSTLLLASPYQSHQEVYDDVVKTGNEVSMSLLKTLGKNLKGHMQKEGPLGAAKFCNEQAFLLTEFTDKNAGKDVSVKRISLKDRNPANRPVGSEKTVMNALQNLQDSNVILPKFLVERVDKNTIKYYKPLNINKGVCLKCHGNITNPKLSKFLKDHYPNDKATNYKMGDLRGAVVVTIKK
ncbi:MAG: DUF3365 domain-containing protein [Campylobacterota bacterium]|nr:DUF3365 domain-containing protein [Campylobacterota bacterium]